MKILYYIVAIAIFGFLILIHELGHYLFARLFGVTVHEFSIGMGPKLFSHVSDNTDIEYSIRALPIGGFVAMEGENGETGDPDALACKPIWQRAIILAAGGIINILAGIIVMSVLVATSESLASTMIYQFTETATSNHGIAEDGGLREGDIIIAVDGARVHTGNELVYEIMHRATEPIPVTVIRDGEKTVVEDVYFPTVTEQGIRFGEADFYVYSVKKTPLNVLKFAYYRSFSTVKMIWESLFDLLRGKYGMEAVSGPVGATKAVAEAAETGWDNLFYLAAVLTMNLGIMNLLPFPALDGGRLFFLLIEAIFRKPVPRTVEGLIHFGGVVVLMIFMLIITGKDILAIFR